MSKKENVAIKKPYNAGYFLKDVMIFQVVALYITLIIGDEARTTADELITTRYIPLFVVGLLAALFSIRRFAKMCNKTEKEKVRKNIFLIPVLIAAMIFIFGLYSVSVQMAKMEKFIGIFSSIGSEEGIDNKWQEELDNTANEIRMRWFIASMSYLVAGELAGFLTSKKLDKWLKEPEEELMEENVNETLLEEKEENTDVIKNESPIDVIKWDL